MLWLAKGWDRIAPGWELSLVPAPPAPNTPPMWVSQAWGFAPSSRLALGRVSAPYLLPLAVTEGN